MYQSLFGTPRDIPQQRVEKRAFTSQRTDVNERLVGIGRASAVATGQYSAMAAGLYRARESRRLHTLLVASAAPGEGKSLTAANLGLTLSGAYRQSVLLIDADLHRPTLHAVFGVDNLTGLNDSLALDGNTPIPVQVADRLSLLPAGCPDADPTALLTSVRMHTVLHEMSECFEWVIVDAPPLTVLPDASLLARMVDAVALVVRAGRTPLRLIEDAVRSLGRERILGMVLNHAEEESVRARYARKSRYASI